jgi:hypothetical protein
MRIGKAKEEKEIGRTEEGKGKLDWGEEEEEREI